MHDSTVRVSNTNLKIETPWSNYKNDHSKKTIVNPTPHGNPFLKFSSLSFKAETLLSLSHGKVMTLNEYEKMRKPVLSTKTTEEKTVDSKGFESMKLLKKGNHEIFVKLAQNVLKFIYPRPKRGRGRGENQLRTHGDNQGRGHGENQGRDNGDNNGRGTANNQERFNDRSGGLHNCSGDYGGGGGSGGNSGGGVYGSRSSFDGSAIAGGYGGSGGEYGVTVGGGNDNFLSGGRGASGSSYGSSTVSGGHSQNHPLDDELGTLLTSGRG
ncbi:hypothetical protein IFM89_024053 [Coptis chinensis]|uniref:Uncharacterized protein n=1 Tax=Coptis chinensis TaxID=261450 RepID=A0A835HDX0_9MAGN|nr:hypothetical protein IFM89_024053 [Coptis chinensis]